MRFPNAVGVPLLSQFSIALLTGLVAGTCVPSVRKSIPKIVEIGLWIAFVSVCMFTMTSITDRNARELSASAVWGADQVINTMIGLTIGGIGGWILDHRFPISSWLVILAGADILALTFLRSLRSGQKWMPPVHLGEWIEVAAALGPVPARPTVAQDPLADINRRAAALTAIACTACLAKIIELSIWIRDESAAQFESLREMRDHLQYAARAWFAAAVEPALGAVAERAKRGLRPAALRPGADIDIWRLLSAQSNVWYGPPAGSTLSTWEEDAPETQESDRLAS